MKSIEKMFEEYEYLKRFYNDRDSRMLKIKDIRSGKMSAVGEGWLPEAGEFTEPIIANTIDVAARDMAEMIAPLPNFTCNTTNTVSASGQKMAGKRTKIVNGYITTSSLQTQMYDAADQYVSYGFLPIRVEIDYERQAPYIRTLNPIGSYPVINKWGQVTGHYQKVVLGEDELCDAYPELESVIRKNGGGLYGANQYREVVFHHDAHGDTVFLTGETPTKLHWSPNPIGRCMVFVAQRPGVTAVPRGQFDDVIFIQLAKNRLALLALQMARETVNAPIVVPNDVLEFPSGPRAVIRTSEPQGVRRVPLEVPSVAFGEQDLLQRELDKGSRFPSTRTGNSDASIVTGRGVQALQEGYDSQVRAHQAIFANTFRDVIGACLEADEKIFGPRKKKLRGSEYGVSFEVEYTPEKDIAGDYTVDVKYGLMAGLDPSRWLVFALQARAEKMFSRDYMRREMPIDINIDEETRKIDVEDMEEALKTSIQGLAQAIPGMAAQGQNPMQVIDSINQVIAARKKGTPISDAVAKAFTPPEPEPTAAPEGAVGAQSPEEQLLQQAAQSQGQPGLPPGFQSEQGRQQFQQFLTGMNSEGEPQLASGTLRRENF